MEKNYNKQQANYLAAKTLLETLEAKLSNIEYQYIVDHKIINSDGSIPKGLYAIDNAEVFNKALEAVFELDGVAELQNKLEETQETLEDTEEELIKFGLTVLPSQYEKQRASLEEGSKNSVAIREQLIKIIMELNVSTIPNK